MICDPSHICGCREYIADISQQAADLDYDGLMIESHINPDEAWSDAKQQVTPEGLFGLLDSVVWRSEDSDSESYQRSLDELRGLIDSLDSEIINLLARRMAVAEDIGRIKRDNNVMILQPTRWNSLVESAMSRAESLGLSRDFLSALFEAIHLESIDKQRRVLNK